MSKELLFPMGILAIIASMLISLPPTLIDLLLVGNIILALLLFFGALHISDTLKLSALPTILLLTTLYRLSLNVSTTRLILSGGDVGSVIPAFGNAVTAGNLVVGAVIFCVITLVQFIVVAKGAERVAEVSARFTLDALPGKQMSIDADVRSGLIDFQTARTKRENLQTESRFYGALDGAMKFVKGDAIAGLIITAINVAGGLCIGIIMQGYGAQQALARYTMLTVGDGLLSQIPALLYALAAGMIVTRVQSSSGTSLASDLITQLSLEPKVRVLVGAIAVLICAVPGMPVIPFAVCGIGMLCSAVRGGEEVSTAGDQVRQEEFTPTVIASIEIQISSGCSADYTDQDHQQVVYNFQKWAYTQYGLILEAPHKRVMLTEAEGKVLLFLRGVLFEEIDCDGSSVDLQGQIESALRNLLTIYTDELIDDSFSRRMLDHLEQTLPELVSTVVPEIVSVTQLTGILRDLVHEQVDIKGFDRILQAIAEVGKRVSNEREILEHVRKRMKRVISASIREGGEPVKLIAISPEIDIAFAQAELNRSAPDESIIEHLQGAIEQNSESVAMVTSSRSRRLMQECLEAMAIKVKVIAHEEIEEGIQLKIVKNINMPGGEGEVDPGVLAA